MTKEFSEAQFQELQLALQDKKNNAHYYNSETSLSLFKSEPLNKSKSQKSIFISEIYSD